MPPSCAHGGRFATSEFAAAGQGYWFAATSSPAARAAATFASISGIRPQFSRQAVLKCQMLVGIAASRAIVITSSIEASISRCSERWWVK